ncbi:MAG: CoA pyrophosphatase [Deltaproteobacteria bacterium]|nr:CoA pyrophosphatase [Deltaproteobacteria bacterium]
MTITASCLKQSLHDTILPEPPAGDGFKAACVFLLIFNLDKRPLILAIQKADNEGYPWRNQVALPGGHVDKSDTGHLNAAYRELEEEVNIPPEHVEFVGSMGHFQTIFGRDVEVFIGLWNEKSHVVYDPAEISRMIKIPIDHLVKTHQQENFAGRMPDVYTLIYPYEDITIWGLTAKILHFFIEMMLPCLKNPDCIHL